MDLRPIQMAVAVTLGALWLTARAAQPEAGPAFEYEVEAAFLYHFAEFVSWPPEALPLPDTPITIGILGEDRIGLELENAVRDKRVKGHPLQVLQVDLRSTAKLRQCHILFVSPSEKRSQPQLFEVLKGASVLTVGRTERFTQAGGMINFFVQDNKVRFEINDAAARNAGLKISSKLLSLAKSRE
jgi:uncharacterized protein DUF4154